MDADEAVMSLECLVARPCQKDQIAAYVGMRLDGSNMSVVSVIGSVDLLEVRSFVVKTDQTHKIRTCASLTKRGLTQSQRY